MKIGFQVRAHIGNSSRAIFNIAEGRSAYFFKDRDVQVNENGRSKKIFHYVTGYQRSDGRIVEGHTKGLREFRWNGYDVHIGIPGIDYADVRKFTASARATDDQPTSEWIDSGDMADAISNSIEQSPTPADRASRKRRGR